MTQSPLRNRAEPDAIGDVAQFGLGATVELLLVYCVLTFFFHFAWEVLQTPFFARMPTMSHWAATLVCLKATIGDVGIALAAFAAGSWWSHKLHWTRTPSWQAISVFLAVGVAATIAFEWYAVSWANRWAYSEAMPIVPVLRVGIAPILQWIVLPPLVIYFVRRHRLSFS